MSQNCGRRGVSRPLTWQLRLLFASETFMKYGRKVFLSSETLFFTRYLPIEIAMFVHIPKSGSFSLNCSKVAEECNWNSKIPQNVNTLGFFRKQTVFFEHHEFFSKSLKLEKFSHEAFQIVSFQKNLSTLFVEFFWLKMRKISKLN